MGATKSSSLPRLTLGVVIRKINAVTPGTRMAATSGCTAVLVEDVMTPRLIRYPSESDKVLSLRPLVPMMAGAIAAMGMRLLRLSLGSFEMPLHILKLSVGVDSVDQVARIQARRLRESDEPEPRLRHFTRHRPRRAEEIVAGGSIYWVIGGFVQVRQRIVAIERVEAAEGKKCAFVLDPVLVLTEWQPRRPHQGWRYLKAQDAPADVRRGTTLLDLPVKLQKELRDLGLL